MYCKAKKRECKYAMSITVQLDKEYDRAEGIREYTMCGTPKQKVHFGNPCIFENDRMGEC